MDIQIPDGFQFGVAQEGSDSFFSAAAQGLNQIRPGEESYDAKLLRLACKAFASTQDSWLTNCLDRENQTLQYYAANICSKSSRNGEDHVICGRPHVEGRIICQVFDVEIHVIEKGFGEPKPIRASDNETREHNLEPLSLQEGTEPNLHAYSVEFRTDQIINELGSKYMNERSCYSDDTIHLLKEHDHRFVPILRQNTKNLPSSLGDNDNLHLHGSDAVYVKVYEDVEANNFIDAMTDVSRGNRMFIISGQPIQNTTDELVNFLRVKDSQTASKIACKVRDGSIAFLPIDSKEVAVKRFRQLCQKKKDKVIYWVELASCRRIQLLWVYDAKFYLARRFYSLYKDCRGPTIENEDQLCEKPRRKVELLAYGAGMSTTVASLASRMTEHHAWVIVVDIQDCLTALANIPANKRGCNLTLEDFYVLLCQVRGTGFPNNDLKEIFRLRMLEETRDRPPILIVFNGFRSYRGCYTEEDRTVELLVFLKQRTSAVVWVVASESQEMYLEACLSVGAIRLTDFNMAEVADYLRNFWKVRFGLMFTEDVIESVLKKYSKDLIKQAMCNSRVGLLQLSNAPASLRLFAEGLQSYIFKLCKAQDGINPESPLLTLTDVVQRFIDERYHVAYRGKSWFGEPQLRYSDFSNDLDKFHQHLACTTAHVHPVHSRLPFIDTYTLAEVGIIKHTTEPHFVHKVFMLYFYVTWIVSNMKREDSNTQKIEAISFRNVFQSCQEVVSDFVVHLLAKESDELVAALTGDLNKVAAQIQAENHIAPEDKLGRTALHMASLGGHYDIVATLLAAGYDPFQCGVFDRTPLHYAAMHGYHRVVNLLTNYAADIDINDHVFRTTLPDDTEITDCIFVDSRQMDSSLVTWVNKEDYDGKSSLHYAIDNQHWSTACMLILNGACLQTFSEEPRKNLLQFILESPLEQYCPILGLLFAYVPNAINKLTGRCPKGFLWQACESIVREDYIASLVCAFRRGQVCLGVIDVIFGRIRSCVPKAEIMRRVGTSVDLMKSINRSDEFNDCEHLRVADYVTRHHKGRTSSHLESTRDLASAARQGHVKTLKYYLAKQQANRSHMYAMQEAIDANQFIIVDYLWKLCRSCVKAYGPYYNTALHYAAARGRVKLVKYLVENGADVNATNALGETPLYHAADGHNLDVVRYLVASGSRLVVSDYCSRQSPRKLNVKDAASVMSYFLEEYLPEFGNPEEKKSISRYIDIKETGTDGRTPFLCAAATAKPIVVCHLIAKGADVNFESLKGETALRLAVENEKENGEIVKILFENGAVYDKRYADNCRNAGTAQLLESVHRMFADASKAIRQDGVDGDHVAAVFNARDSNLNTVLHLACEAQQMDVVRFILKEDRSSCLNAMNRWQESPLHIASRRGNPEIVDNLLLKGAIFNSRNSQDNTPKDIAEQFGHKDVFNLLQFTEDLFAVSVHNEMPDVESRLWERNYVRVKDKNGKTMLHWVAQHGFKDMAALLLRYGADADAVDAGGWTPLHCAASHGHQEMCEVLLQHGAMFDAVNRNRLTALQLDGSGSCVILNMARCLFNDVRDGNSSSVLKILKAMKAEHLRPFINMRDSEGNTLLHLCLREARRECYWELAKFLLKHQAAYDAKNQKGETPESICPIHYAKHVLKFIRQIFCWKRKLVCTLRSFESQPENLNAILNARDVEGRSVLHTAAKVQPIDYFRLEFFVEHGADVNAEDLKGCTVLEYAIQNENLDFVMFLLKNEANVLRVPIEKKEDLIRIADCRKGIISTFKTLENRQRSN